LPNTTNLLECFVFTLNESYVFILSPCVLRYVIIKTLSPCVLRYVMINTLSLCVLRYAMIKTL